MVKLSIIIPIYKVEKYIVECLESVCCQLIDGVEVILVNDGTPDQSMHIAKKYINENYMQHIDKFVFVDQENQGLSGARNTGILHSKGEYLMFLDSDDRIDGLFFSKLYTVLEESGVDLIQFKAYRFYDQSSEKINFMPDSPYTQKHVIDDDILKFIFNSSNWFAWLRIYHKKLFDTQKFPVRKLYEDAYITPFIFFNAKTIYFINECLLGYRFNEQGITAKITGNSLDDLRGVAEVFVKSIPKCKYFSSSLISISQYYILQSLRSEGYIKALRRWSELRGLIRQSDFDKSLLENRGNILFYRYGIFFIFVEQLWLKMKGKK